MKKLSAKKIKSRIYDNTHSGEYISLLKNLDETKSEIEYLKSTLNFVTEPILLNQLIFQIKAAEVRYQYWFFIARKLETENLEKNIQTNV